MQPEDPDKSNVDTFVKQSIAKFELLHSNLAKDTHDTIAPLISSRSDIAKTLITLSAAILTLTVSASSGILSRYLQTEKHGYLIATWSLLVITILFDLASLWMSMKIIRTILEFKNSASDYVNEIKSVIDKDKSELRKIMIKRNKPFDTMNILDKAAHYLLGASFFSFFTAMIIFLMIGSSASSISQSDISHSHDSIQNKPINSAVSSGSGSGR